MSVCVCGVALAVLEDNIWYYRDRAGVPRGPCTTGTLRTCWVNGIIDQYTLVWGMGLGEWLPVRNVTSLEAIIRNAETIVLTYAKRKLILEPALRRKAQERKRRSQELQQQQSKQGSSTAAAVAVYEDSQQQSAVARGAGESGLTQEGEQSQTPQQPRQSRRSRSAAACLSLAIPLEHALATDAGDVCTSNSE